MNRSRPEILVAVLVFIAICGVSIAWFLERSSDISTAKMIDSCEVAHHLERQSSHATTANGMTFDFCAWPPPSWADRDGYSEIVVLTVSGPGLGEASDADETDYITIPCHVVQLTYDFGSQGDYAYRPPITAKAGAVLDEDGTSTTKYRSQLPGYPSRDQVVYLHNMKEGLYSANCVR